MDIKEIMDKDFGKIVMMSNGVLELGIMVDAGPRIIHLALAGMGNVMYQDREKKPLGEKMPPCDDIFRLYGGHRLWISPEILPRCYHPDNEPVQWEKTAYGVRFTAAVEKHNGIEKTMLISIDGNTVKVNHEIRNCNLWDIELAPWALTMLTSGGCAKMTMTAKKTGLLPNRHMVFWDYTDLADSRLNFGSDCVTLKQDPAANNPIKLGWFNDEPNSGITYTVAGQKFYKHAKAPAGTYPDFGCNYEAFTNPDFLEAESLGAMTKLAPGETTHHEETWTLTAEA